MTAKRTSNGHTANGSEPAVRKTRFAAGKRATIATKPGYDSCMVLVPVDVQKEGHVVFSVALQIAPSAGKVSFVPRGKETVVIDGPKGFRSTDPRVVKLLRSEWQKKGGEPPPVKD